jgi:hypothetical protein
MSSTTLGHTQPPIQCVPGFLVRGKVARVWCDVNNSTHLLLRLRMSGAIPLLLYAFMVWTEKTVPIFTDLSCDQFRGSTRTWENMKPTIKGALMSTHEIGKWIIYFKIKLSITMDINVHILHTFYTGGPFLSVLLKTWFWHTWKYLSVSFYIRNVWWWYLQCSNIT